MSTQIFLLKPLRVAIIFFSIESCKKTHAKVLIARHFMIIFCLIIVLDWNSFISNLKNTVDWGRKKLFDFSAGKTQLASFAWPNNTGVIDSKMDRSVLEEKSEIDFLF